MTSKLNEVRELDGLLLGKKNTLVYTLKAEGEQGKGQKMVWIMQEYVLDESLGSLFIKQVLIGGSNHQSITQNLRLASQAAVVNGTVTHNLMNQAKSPSTWLACQLPTKSSPFQVDDQFGQINNRLIGQYLVYECSGSEVGKSSSEAACQLTQQQPELPNQQEAFVPLSSVTPPTREINETNSSGLMVFNHNQYIRQLPTMIDRNDPLIPPMVNYDDQYGFIAAGSRGQQIPFESSSNVGFQKNLVFSNEHDDHQQLQNNMST
ncbi:unnamed protein product [Ilex paraguariensis]|uniref:NAC domain-containing protein n=1 Tax=Ilex paraguariensis TaxID=185542 RepID=A0ABC8V0J7_9AQUA